MRFADLSEGAKLRFLNDKTEWVVVKGELTPQGRVLRDPTNNNTHLIPLHKLCRLDAMQVMELR